MNRCTGPGLARMVYQSRHFDLDLTHLRRILLSSRRNNALLGVTGLLIHSKDMFLQVIEGAPDAVRYTYSRIALDVCHHDLQLLSDESVDQRLFPDWSMACVPLDAQSHHHLMGRIAAGTDAVDQLLSRLAKGLALDGAGEPCWDHYKARNAIERGFRIDS